MNNIYQTLITRLSEAQIDSPRLEARLLIGYVTGLSADDVSASVVLTDAQAKLLERLLASRLAHKPIDKILGRKDFYKYTFLVDEDVLSPRPDTEILVEEALRLIRQNHLDCVADLGTGSGCILCSLAAECPNLCGTGVDKSLKALAVATKNAEKLGVSERLSFVCADWFEADFEQKLNPPYDLIVSNPPYIAHREIAELSPEVSRYDPTEALDGGADGYESYRQIALKTCTILREDGYILLEAGIGQADEIQKIFEEKGLICQKIAPDLAGIDRCLIFKRI